VPAPNQGGFLVTPGEFRGNWKLSPQAGKYYWSKWPGVDLDGNKFWLSQYDWSNPEWQAEVEKILRFWME